MDVVSVTSPVGFWKGGMWVELIAETTPTKRDAAASLNWPRP